MNKLQRMIVVPAELFDKWKNIVVADEKLSLLDRNMKHILYNSKINDFDKWKLYRENLVRYKIAKQNNIKKAKMPTTETGTQTSFFKRPTKETQTEWKMAEQTDMSTQDIDELRMSRNKERGIPLPMARSASKVNIDSDEDDNNKDSSFTYEYDYDDEMRKSVLEGLPETTKIVKERTFLDPDEFRVFELNTGEVVSIPVPTKSPERRLTRSVLRKNSGDTQTKLNVSDFKKLKKQRDKLYTGSAFRWAPYK